MPEISAQPQGQGTAATVVPTPATTQTPSLYPQAILDALAKEGIVPEDVIDLEKWWITAKEGDQCAVAVGDCITVNSMFYMVVAECPPFEKSAGLTSFDMITLINFMAGFFVQMYP